jgi:uncharacterized membrane protein
VWLQYHTLRDKHLTVTLENMLPARPAARLAYLDWLRGLAVVIMIETHVFHSFTRPDLRNGSAYLLSQFVGGMAAPLFLFLAGMMVGLRIENRDDKGLSRLGRAWDVLKRAGYILLIAELILLQQYLFQGSLSNWRYLLRVDILNCMALAIAVSCVVALAPRHKRPGAAIALGAGIAALSPVMCALDWHGVPALLQNYLIPGPGRFAFFPEAAYVPFGIAAGFVIRRAGEKHVESAMAWMSFAGFGLIYGGEFFSNQPYSLYSNSDFWVNSPGLIVIRTGLMLAGTAAGFLWTRFGFALGIVRQLGTTSLLVYWLHVELVYGSWLQVLKKQLSAGQAALATIVIIALMYGVSVAKTRWFPAIKPALSARLPARTKLRASRAASGARTS